MTAQRKPRTTQWTFKLSPLPDELLSSWLCRVAHAHGMTPHAFTTLHWPAVAVWNRDIDRSATEEWLADVAEAAGLALDAVRNLTLRPLMDILAKGGNQEDSDHIRGNAPLVLSAGVWHRRRLLPALQFCPICLAHGEPYFRRSWRLATTVGCTTHKAPLRERCVSCSVPASPHRAPVGRMVECHDCGNPLDLFAISMAGRSPAGPLSMGARGFVTALGLQHRLECALVPDNDATGAPVPAKPFDGPEGFAVMRSLISATTSKDAHIKLRRALDDCTPPWRGIEHGKQFEKIGTQERAQWMETIACWTTDWAKRFGHGAESAGITQRTFARLAQPNVLAKEVRRLKAGVQRKRKPWSSILNDATMRKLKRTDPAAWRQLRAARILAGKAVPPC